MQHRVLMLCFLWIGIAGAVRSQDATALAAKVKAKLATVNDYQAKGRMKIDVSFMKVPDSDVAIFFKKPNKFRIKKQDGLTVTPKGGVSISLNSMIAGDNYTAIQAGNTTINGLPIIIIKLVPLDETSEVVVSTLYVNEKDLLIYKASSTTKDNGTYEMEMTYGKFARWGLPDKIVFFFNTKDYKLPKGLALDYETAPSNADKNAAKNQKGKVEITYSDYSINKGIPDSLFQ